MVLSQSQSQQTQTADQTHYYSSHYADDIITQLNRLQERVEELYSCKVICLGLPCNITTSNEDGGHYIYTDNTFCDARPFGSIYRKITHHASPTGSYTMDYLIVMPVSWQARAQVFEQLLSAEGPQHWDRLYVFDPDATFEAFDQQRRAPIASLLDRLTA